MTALQAPMPQPAPQAETDTDSDQTVGELAAAQAAKAAPQAAAASDTEAGDTAPPALGKSKDDGKADAQGIKGAARKAPAADTKTAAADDLKADAAKPDDAKTGAPQPADLASAKPAPQTAAQAAAAADTNVTIAAPQAATPASATPAVTQHVQVSAEPPSPNMPGLAVQIVAKSQSGARQFDIRLDPPELGRVDVRLSIDATGKASAHLTADQPQTLDMLQKDSTSLTRALREAGLDVSQDGLNFSLRQQAQQNGQGNGQGANNAPGFSRGSLSATNTIDATAASAAYRAPADGRLDIRV
jgi:flagellar hook-length control protein FliK